MNRVRTIIADCDRAAFLITSRSSSPACPRNTADTRAIQQRAARRSRRTTTTGTSSTTASDSPYYGAGETAALEVLDTVAVADNHAFQTIRREVAGQNAQMAVDDERSAICSNFSAATTTSSEPGTTVSLLPRHHPPLVASQSHPLNLHRHAPA